MSTDEHRDTQQHSQPTAAPRPTFSRPLPRLRSAPTAPLHPAPVVARVVALPLAMIHSDGQVLSLVMAVDASLRPLCALVAAHIQS